MNRLRSGLFALLALHAALALHTALRWSPLWDEVVYPAAGYDLITQGRIRTSLDHPPLAKILFALPYIGTGPRYDAERAIQSGSFYAGFEFLHAGPGAKTRILLPRLVSILLSVLLGGLVFGWTRKLAGDGAALA